MNRNTTLFGRMLLIFLVLASQTYAYKFIIYGSPTNEKEPFYSSLLYLVVYAFLWNFIIEISLIIVLHFKQTPMYVANHSFINICIVIGQILNNIGLIKSFGVSDRFLLLEGILTFMEVIQILLGNSLNQKLQSEKLVKKIFILRFIHRNNGRILYLLRKYQLISYAFLYFKNIQIAVPGIALAPILLVTILTHIFAYILLRKNVFVNSSKKQAYLIHTNKDMKQTYLELLKNIEQGNTEEFNSSSNLIDEESSIGIQLLASNVKWIVIEDKVYDITGFRHPKGNYILKGIEGKDVTREMHGFKGYRFESNNKKFSKMLKHKHVPRTFEYLDTRCIGPISICPLICNIQNDTDITIKDSVMSIPLDNLMESVDDGKMATRELDWKSENIYDLSDQGSIVYVQKTEKDYLVNLSVYWLYTFGKYFVITHNNGKKDFMYALLSLTPVYIYKKLEWYKKLNKELISQIKLPSDTTNKNIHDLYITMSRGLDRDQKQALETTNEIRSFHLPLYWQKTRNSKRIKKSNHKLLGPVGFGLGFDSSCCFKTLIIAKNEGIIPLIDFFEFLSQKALIELTGVAHPIFTNEYLYAYSNNPEFSLYWEVSEEYWPTAEALALGVLHAINMTYKRDSTRKVKKLVKLITISSILATSQNNIVLTVANEKRDFNDIIKLNNSEFERYVVSGDDKFVNRILASSTASNNTITVL